MTDKELDLLKKIIVSGQDSGKFFTYWKNEDYKCFRDDSDGSFHIVHTNGTMERLRTAHNSGDFQFKITYNPCEGCPYGPDADLANDECYSCKKGENYGS